MKCPNKNLPEYKKLEKLYGENLAYYYWDLYDGNIPQNILEGEESKPNENVYYNKSSKMVINVSDFKKTVSNNLMKAAQDAGVVAKKKMGGHYYVKMSDDRSFKRDISEKEKLFIVRQNLERLNRINRLSGEAIDRYIITNRSNKFWIVEINPNYLDNAWEEFKITNDRIDQSVERGTVTPSTHNPFSSDYIHSNRNRLSSGDGEEKVSDLEEKLVLLSKAFPGIDVEYDFKMKEVGRYYPQGKNATGVPTIVINPTIMTKDVAIHEFGHLYVDLLGGMNNPFIKRGRELLNGSTIEKKVLKAYKDMGMSKDEMDVEILVTAIGFEGATLFELDKKSPFQRWVTIFFNKLKLLIGINGNVAMELAQRMLYNEVNKQELVGELGKGFQRSLTMSDEENSSKEDKELDRIITKITDRVIILRRKYDKSGNDKFKKEVGKLLSVLENHRDAKGLMRYVDEVLHQTEQIQKRLDGMLSSENPIDGDTIKNIYTFLGAFNLVEDIRPLFREIKRQARTEEDAVLLRLLNIKELKLNEASQRINNINADYAVAKEKFLVETLTPHSNRMRGKWRKDLEIEFYANEGSRKKAKSKYGKELKNVKEEYINTKLAEKEDLIKEQEKEYITRILKLAPKDIGYLEAWVSDAKNIDDHLIQIAIKLLDKADFDAMNRFLEERTDANDIWEEYYEYSGKESNQQKLYKGIIEEVNGAPTNHLVGKYLSSFKEAEKDFYDRFDGNPPKKDMIKFYTIEKKKYLNPQYEALMKLDVNNPKRKMYDYLIKTAEKKDLMSPASYSLGINMGKGDVTYKLPSIEKNTMERLYEQGIFTAGKEKLKDVFFKDTSDTEYGELVNPGEVVEGVDPRIKEVTVDESGKLNQTIPIHYRGRLSKPELQSFDLIGITLMDFNSLVNYEEKAKSATTLELLRDQFGEREVRVMRGGKFLFKKAGSSNSSYVTTNGIESNSYKVLNSIIQDRLYGISSVDMGDINILGKDISINKAANAIMGWTGHTMLMFNWAAGGVNLMQGKYQNFLESTASREYSGKDAREAEKLYMKDSAAILSDVGRRIPKSKTNLLIEKFNAFSDFSGLSEKFSLDSRGKRLVNTNTGHFINHSGEHYIQATVMYSILNATKVKNNKGELIPLHEAYNNVDGKLVLKEEIILPEDFEFQVSRKIKETIKQLHGNYDSKNQSMVQRYVAGKFAFMLRKWMVVGTQRRWRGLKNVGLQNRGEDDVAFNSILEKEMEGYYTTTLRFVNEIKSELLRLQFGIISGEWNNLTDDERANIRKTIWDLSTMASSLIAALVLAGLGEDADDDDKELYYTAAYLFRRHYSELSFYTNPMEGQRILRTPAASLSMIDRTYRLIAQLFDPLEEYQAGPRKGSLKIKRYAGQVFPVFGQLDRNLQDSYEWLAK